MIGLSAWALAGCATPGDETPGDETPSPLASQPLDDLALLQDGADPVVAGETLNGTLLRRFYARRDFEPVWTSRPAEADALAQSVLRAADHGLDPDLFHAHLLRRAAIFPPLRRELLLSHAVLSYAEALAFGAMPAAQRKDSETLAPDPVDVAAVLDAGLESPSAVTAIEALAPGTPTYLALRQALQWHRSNGSGDAASAHLPRLIAVNMERQRWLPRRLPADRVWVNVADQRLVLYRDDEPVFTTRVAVGEELERKQSPEFHTVIEGAFFNPPWVIPADIVQAAILPRIEQDADFLKRNNIVLLPNGEAEQAPGPNAGVGVIMFDMPNRFDVYLHDTPNKAAFENENRRVSNGCIRVSNPLELAALLMDEPLGKTQGRVANEGTLRKALPRPVPVFVVYQTVFASPDRRLEVRPDFYSRDAAIWRRLHKRPPEWHVQPTPSPRLPPARGPRQIPTLEPRRR